MNIKEFYSLNEIQKYYDEESNTYVFKEKDDYIDLVVFNFYLDIKANIDCWNINAMNIKAWGINTINIIANDISYWAVCYAYNNIKCKSIKGRRKNAKHFVLDGKLEVIE